MLNKRVSIFCLILVILIVALQAAPRILGLPYIYAVILMGLPVYIAARFNWAYGTAVYLAAAVISASMNTGEALFFLCNNGFIGLSLGILKSYFKKNYTISAIPALIVGLMLFIVNYFFKINIFGSSVIKIPILQALTLFSLLYVYCLIYLKLAIYANNLIRRNIEFNFY